MKRFLISVLFLFFMGFTLFAQVEDPPLFDLSGNLTAIFTLGNANPDMKLGMGTGAGAYEERKNGWFTEAIVHVRFNPFPYLEGYFKLLATSRSGSFYVPLSLEPKSEQTFGLSLDRAFGRVSVFNALGFSLPVDLYLKTGKYKGEANNYQTISKYQIENILYKMETANTLNYEIEIAAKPMNNDFTISGSFIGNYQFDEGIQRLFDNDGGVSDHGYPVLGEYAPNFMGFIRLTKLDLGVGQLNGELAYGMNVADIYSGNSFGAGFSFNLAAIADTLDVPIGLGFVWHEKNIDLLSKSASVERDRETYDFRNTLSAALSAGVRFQSSIVNVDVNIAGVLTRVQHIYRDPLQIISASLDLQATFLERYFIGGGAVFGTLTSANWKTKDDPKFDPYAFDHTFKLLDNMGFEVYGGLNLGKKYRFIIGFNQNKGIAMNYNIENKAEGQMKYQLAGWDGDGFKLYETGGFFLKFMMSL
jgi:hypothetical protein